MSRRRKHDPNQPINPFMAVIVIGVMVALGLVVAGHGCNAGSSGTAVRGYTRRDGTHVNGYTRH